MFKTLYLVSTPPYAGVLLMFELFVVRFNQRTVDVR